MLSLNNQKMRFSEVLGLLVFGLLLYNVFIHMRIESIEWIRPLALLTVDWTLSMAWIFLIILILVNWSSEYLLLPLYAAIGLYVLVNVVTSLINGTGMGTELFVWPIYYLLFFLFATHLRITDRLLIIFGHIVQIANLIYIIHWFSIGLPDDRFISFFTNPNMSGVFFGVIFFFLLAAFIYSKDRFLRIYFGLGLLANLLMIYVSTARSIYILVFIMLVSIMISFIRPKLFRYAFHAMMLFNFAFIFIYNYLALTAFGDKLNELSMSYLHKPLFSGRQHIWGPSLEHGLTAPFSGHGVGVLPRDYMEGTHYVHSHNQYIQIFLESGIFGLLGFTLLLYIIWRYLLARLEDRIVLLVACFYIGLLFYQSVEISFFFNMRGIGLLHWFILAIGVGRVWQLERGSRLD